ncbi:MAG TPA: YbdD/YjiX family protein [Casimicrobiaceae bacterium]|nr:YbdD/YjiX family protein [Casimicrobiaceae bacterium]
MSAGKQMDGVAPASDAPGARSAEPRGGLHALRQACRQIVGIPDYERYLAHMAEHHPGEPVLSRKEYFVRAIDRKYGRSGPRCC